MQRLTKKMREVLKNVDLEQGEINNVPLSTMYGLETRQLVTSEWRKGGSRVVSTTRDAFPSYSRVRLTASGLRAARALQGLRPDV